VELEIEITGAERVDELRELWLALHHHHQQVASLQPLVADDELSWQRRRALYHQALSNDGGFLVIATNARHRVGYAMVRIHEGRDDTWPIADRYAELYSLSVTPDERSRGIGGALVDAVEGELARRGIADIAVAVMTGNTAAMRFYERRGLLPGEVLLYRFGLHGRTSTNITDRSSGGPE
jgi:ribosomal protein S18 acetylase RimI-like enzyme